MQKKLNACLITKKVKDTSMYFGQQNMTVPLLYKNQR